MQEEAQAEVRLQSPVLSAGRKSLGVAETRLYMLRQAER